jgi:alkyl hydroperoxide reductase subunit AhpC
MNSFFIFKSKFIYMSIKLGDTAPNFVADTTMGKIDFYDYLGNNWGILMSHPNDFTPVCTTEIGRTAQLQQEFDKRGAKVLIVSVDPLKDHHVWVKDINEICSTTVDFPIIADPERKVAELFEMIHPKVSATSTIRSVFIIGPDKKVKLTLTYPAAIGRNFTEILRVLDALQLSNEFGISTPADWKGGEDVIVGNAITTEEAGKKFPQGVKVVKPYLRFTPQPNR